MKPEIFNIKSNKFLDCEELNFKPKIEGIFTMKAIKNGRVIREKKFKNLITNQGLDRLAQNSSVFNCCHVGTGTTVPNVTQTALSNFLAASPFSVNTTRTYGTSPDYVIKNTIIYQFAQGTVVGNLTEIGIAWAATGPVLFSRALIVDGANNPTTFTVLADEQLEVTYQIWLYPPVNDVATTQNINGSPVNIVIRPAYVLNDGFKLMQYNFGVVNASIVSARAYTGGKIPIIQTSAPAGNLTDGTSSSATYVAGSYERNCSSSWNVNQGNAAIKTVIFAYQMATFQVEYQTPITKTNTQTLVLPSKLTWGRR
jgi:hypothetical protein